MDIESGIADEVNILKDGTTEQADLLSVITGATHRKTDNTERVASVGSGAKYVDIADGVAGITASVSGFPSNLKCLQYMGSFTDDGDGTYTVEPTETLPTYTMKQQKVGDGGVVTITGYKFGSFKLSAEETGTAMQIEFDGNGKTFKYDPSATIDTPTLSGTLRRPQKTKVKIGGTVVGSVENWSVDFNRNLESFKGIEDFSGTNTREPSAIIEKMYDISFNAIINITDDTAYKTAMDDTSSPYSINESRSNTTFDIVVDTAAGTDTLSLTSVRPDEIAADMANDLEKRTVTLAGVALDWSVDGDL